MSSDEGWQTEEQVLEDLARASGRQVTQGAKLDNRDIVRGNRPPPVRYEAQDDEMRLLFGDDLYAGGDVLDRSTESQSPDLAGITAMLRMVEAARAAEYENVEGVLVEHPGNYVLAISKGSTLNPNVQEFIPKGATSSHSSSDLSEKCSTSVAKTDDSATENAENIDNFKVESAKTVDVDLATRLRNEISDASKSSSFETKKQRNVAISTLLNLYAADDKKSPKNETPPLKLITPDYYEGRSTTVTDEPKTERKTPPPLRKSPRPSTSMSPRPSTSTSSSIEVRSEPALPTQGKSPKKVDPVIKKSIEKVNHWLGEEPPVRKPPPVFLNPVAFKRKDPTAYKSPPKERTVEKETPKPSPIKQFQPTSYAAELEKKYRERSKAEKENKKRNMWTDLDVILKEKDEAKKQSRQRAEEEDD